MRERDANWVREGGVVGELSKSEEGLRVERKERERGMSWEARRER